MLVPWLAASRTLFLAVIASAAPDSGSGERAPDWCAAGGGVLVSVSLSVRLVGLGTPSAAGSHGGPALQACVPRPCADLQGAECKQLRRGFLRRLLDKEDEAPLEEAPAPALVTSGDEAQSQAFWFLHGQSEAPTPADRAAYAALRAVPHGWATPRGKGDALVQLRIATIGTHGPLSALAAEHFLEAFKLHRGSGGALEQVLYGQCYLCEDVPLCKSKHVKSSADEACEWFHKAPHQDAAMMVGEVDAVARDIVEREPRLTAVVCMGLLLCHYVVARLQAHVPRFQLFCMNPLQGSPPAKAAHFLQALERRRASGEPIFTTNAVTSALLAYHLGLSAPAGAAASLGTPASTVPPPALTFFSRDVYQLAKRAPWSSNVGQLLFARNFLLLHDPTCVAFGEALQQTWPHGLKQLATRWDFSDQSQVTELLKHRAVVYIPEHPYKNVFNDFYSAGLPVLVPDIRFLARLWPTLRHTDRQATYDGWFERSIARTRLRGVGRADVQGEDSLEPFDLDVNGAAKVQHWLRLADFYHFPGVLLFGGLAELLQRASDPQALGAVRNAALLHFVSARAAAVQSLWGFAALALRSPSSGEVHRAAVARPPPRGSACAAVPAHGRRKRRRKGEERWPPFTSCLRRDAAVALVSSRQEVSAWRLRLAPSGAGSFPAALRLQVWRPIRVGWQQGARSATFQLVGENRANLRRVTVRCAGSRRMPIRADRRSLQLHLKVPAGRRIAVLPGDVLGWAVDAAAELSLRMRPSTLCHRACAQQQQHERQFAKASPRVSSGRDSGAGLGAPGRVLCVGPWLGGGCRFWPSRRSCRFVEAVAPLEGRGGLLPSSMVEHMEVELGPRLQHTRPPSTIEATATATASSSSSGTQRLGSPPPGPALMSPSFELSWKAAALAMWFLEYATATTTVDTRAWSFFICPPPEDAGEGQEALEHWQRLVSVFGAAVGVSLRCAAEEEAPYEGRGRFASVAAVVEAALRLLRLIVPYGPWLILKAHVGSNTEGAGDEAARLISSANPSGLGFPLWTRIGLGPGCAMRLVAASGVAGLAEPQEREVTACIIPIGSDYLGLHDGLEAPLVGSLAPELAASTTVPWAVYVFSCIDCADFGLVEEPLQALSRLLRQAGEVAVVPAQMRSVAEVVRMLRVRPSLNLHGRVDASTTYEEFMTLRQQLDSTDLLNFEDKIRFRVNLLQPLGVAHTPSYYMSNEDPMILEHIVARDSYVVKPTHMSESEHVIVVKDGRYEFDVRIDGEFVRLAGDAVDPHVIQRHLLSAWNKTAYEWECKAVVAASRGILVEKLVLATLDPGAPDVGRVEEARVHVVWGRATAVEWTLGRAGSTVMLLQVDRVGRGSFSTDGVWATSMAKERLKDADGWAQAMFARCLPQILRKAERVADGAHADHLRVDFLVEGNCEAIFVSEAELFPAVPFPPRTMEALERSWRRGYGVA